MGVRVTREEVDAGVGPGTTTAEAQRIAELERENRELRRSNAILRSTLALFAAELDRPQRSVAPDRARSNPHLNNTSE